MTLAHQPGRARARLRSAAGTLCLLATLAACSEAPISQARLATVVAPPQEAATRPLPPAPPQEAAARPLPPLDGMEPPAPASEAAIFAQQGLASWYGRRFHRRHTASGEHFDMHGLTAAHRSLPLDTLVRVTNLANDRTVLVRINDRGPFTRGRIIDLSHSAAAELGITKAGVAAVRIEVFKSDQTRQLADATSAD